MTKKSRRKLLIIVSASVLAVVLALALPRSLRVDFRTKLARRLHVDPNFLHLNLPPSPQRYPGFAFVIQSSVLPISPPLDRSDLDLGPEFELAWTDLSKSDAATRLSGGPFRGLFSSDTDDKVSLNLRSCRILEAEVGKLKQRLLGIESILKQADAGSRILVITRAYEGQLELRLLRDSHASAGVWAEKLQLAKDAATSASGDLKVATADENQMVLRWSEPVVFAFEAVEAKLFATHLGAKPDRVEFRPVSTAEFFTAAPVPPAINTPPEQKKN